MLRITLLFTILLSWFTAECQVTFPYQVVYAENVFHASGREVKQFTFPLETETLFLREGHLVLAHFSGTVREFTGTDSINIGQILVKEVSVTERANYVRPRVERFFKTSPIHELPEPERRGSIGHLLAATCPRYDIDLLNKELLHENKIALNRDDVWVLYWKENLREGEKLSDYRLVISDIFENNIETVTTKNPFYLVDFSTLPDVKGSMYIFRVEFTERAGSYKEVAVEVPSGEEDHIPADTPFHPEELLMQAYKTEFVADEPIEAYKIYYQLARDHEKPLYGLILENFLERLGQN